MKTLLKNGFIINVFTGEIEKKNVLFERGKILGVGDYADDEASEKLPLTVYVVLPSCVPATVFDESGAVLGAEEAK